MLDTLHRRPTLLLCAIAVLLFGSSGLPGVGAGSADASSLRRNAVVQAVQKATPSVVNIKGRKTIRSDQLEPGVGDPFRQVNGMGTGIIIDHRGYILTNYHVVENVELIQVTLADKRGYVAHLVSHDPVSDLAVVKIDTEEPLPVINVGISSDIMLGEEVIAVGNAFGYEHTVTRGIISALHREVQVSVTQRYQDLIQTDASINPGNSGGPLMNIDGEMVGINVAVRVGAQGIGFAMPVDEAMEIAAQLLTVERVERMVHGVIGQTKAVDTERLFIVARVRENSAAAKSGLVSEDVITAVEQTPIHRRLDFERALLGRRIGEPIALSVQRNGQPHALELVLSGNSERVDNFEERTWNTLGVRLVPMRAEDSRKLHARYRGGMRVVAVRSDGPAARQGIRSSDVLLGMHVWETTSKDNVLYILNHGDFEKFQPMKFFILRGNETLYGHMRVNRGPVLQVSRRVDRE